MYKYNCVEGMIVGHGAKKSQGAGISTPSGVLAYFIELDRRLARPVVGGLAVLASAAIFSGWKIDIHVAATIGTWIVGFGLLLVLIRFIETSRHLKNFLSWFLACFLMLLMSLLLVSAAFPSQTPLPPIYCMARFWEHCGTVGKDISSTLPGMTEQAEAGQTSVGHVSSFRLELEDPTYEEGGKRVWLRKANLWEERYPSGKMDVFIGPIRQMLDGCSGTIVKRQTNGDEVFIPDKGCRTMIVRWRRGAARWLYLGQMRDVT